MTWKRPRPRVHDKAPRPSVPVWNAKRDTPKFVRCGSCGADRESGEACVFCGPQRRIAPVNVDY